MSVQGSKATGRYGVELLRANSIWKVRSGQVTLPNGDSIQVGEETKITVEDVPDNTNTNTNNPEDLSSGKTVSGGVLNGKATSLPKPVYPPAAKAVHASGTVVVQVVVDEKGNVVSARATSGHPLLRSASEVAARAAKFTPTRLSGKPVKVSGVITYNFESEE